MTDDINLDDLLIWWTSGDDCRQLGEPSRESPDTLGPDCPGYLIDEYDSRYGRNGRGRLWAADQFGDIDVSGVVAPGMWRAIEGGDGGSCGGIVFRRGDLEHVARTGVGFVTDLELREVGGPS